MENKLLNKTVLLVDDDPIFLKGLMYSVKSLGYTTLTASSGKEAAEVIKKEKVDVVLSDINMPNGNGLQLLNHILKSSTVPVILMTGLSDLKEAQKALDMGARHFISKPFKKAEISEALSSCFTNAPQDKPKEPMIRIHLEELINGEDLNYPMFLLKDEILVKVSNGGEALSTDMLANYRSSGITFLYMKKTDFLKHLKFNSDGQIQSEIHDEVLKAGKQCLEGLSFMQNRNPEAFERVSIQLDSTLEVLLSNKVTADLLHKMTQFDGFMKRSAYVSVMSCLIGHYIGSMSTKQFFHVMVAGLFHELALMGHPLLENTKHVDELNFVDRMILMSHPETGARAVSQMSLFSEEVVLMIEQHHEEESGSGYPHKIVSKFIHPLSKILCVGDAIAFQLESRNATDSNLPEIIHKFTVESLGKYDLKVLEALNHVFGFSMPEEFVNYQLMELLNHQEAV